MVKRKLSKPKDKKWRGGRGARYVARRKACSFCVDKVESIDYKAPEKLRGYILFDGGKIAPRHSTGTCARHQRALAVAIKRARHLALLPYVPAHIRKVGSAGTGN